MEEYLNDLRDKSIYIKLEAKEKIAGAIDLDNLIKVLNSISQSYKCFLEIELDKNETVKSSTPQGRKEVKHFIKESELLIVDLDFASFGAAICPNTVTTLPYSNIKDGLNLKKKTFEEYKSDVFYADYKDPKFIQHISQKYTDEERANIFKPLVSNIYSNPSIKFYYGKDKEHLKLFSKGSLNKSTLEKLIPTKISSEDASVKKEDTYAIYVTSSDEMDLFGKKPKYSKVLATQKLERPVYPYQLNEIKLNNKLYLLKKVLSAEVTYEDNLFYIKYPDLNIEVWGEDRVEAEEAFNFMLKNVITNIYLEKDEKLTPKAQIVKSIIKDMIK